jgi:hypothetical protein
MITIDARNNTYFESPVNAAAAFIKTMESFK